MSYNPLHHKYRPQTFGQLVGQNAIAKTLSNAITTQRIAPAYLFTGPRGTGKTSSARILSKSLNCLHSGQPTPTPCGECQVCREIANGSALDIIEIDAASNTGVDNIREIIERAQFAPVQCRYKVYVIDECLTGDSLILTEDGLMRIDDPNLKGKKVVSYNEETQIWEYKTVLRWLDQGVRNTVIIKTDNREIQCTDNHLIRTNRGWVSAKDIVAGMEILSPLPTILNSYYLTQAWKFGQLAGYRFTGYQSQNKNLTTLQEVQAQRTPENQHWRTNVETVQVVKDGHSEPVYDIEVEDNHNFVANGLLVHNCHMLSTAAFNALLKTLEEPPSRVVFVLATTDPQRVLPTIISRCQRFDFRRIPLTEMEAHLKDIAIKENIDIQEDAIALVSQIANGGLRDAESLLDQLSLLPDTITVNSVWDLVGAVPEHDLLAILEAIHKEDTETLLDRCRNLLDRGREPLTVLQNLASFYRDCLIAKQVSNRSDLVSVTAPTWEQLCIKAKDWETIDLIQGQQRLKESEVQLKNTTQPRLWLEITILGLLPSANRRVVESLPSSSPSFPQVNRPPVSVTPPPPVTHPQPIPTSPPPQAAPRPQTPTQESPASPSTPATPPSTPKETHPPAQVPSGGTQSLFQIWQQIISYLPKLSQALAIEHFQLVSLEGSLAKIDTKNSRLLKIAEKQKGNFELACQQVFQRQINVQFVVSNTPPNSQNVEPSQPTIHPIPNSPVIDEPNSESNPTNNHSVGTLEPVAETNSNLNVPNVSNGQTPEFGNPESRQSPVYENNSVIQESSEKNSSPPPPTEETAIQQPSPLANLSSETMPETTVLATESTEEDVERAVKSLVNFFKGEIINSDDEF